MRASRPRHVASDDWIDNRPIREAVETAVRNGTSYNEICNRLGWSTPDGNGDTSRLRRRIGAMPYLAGNGVQGRSHTIHYDVAVSIADAINVDPVDLGL
jgi:hypothetical protein